MSEFTQDLDSIAAKVLETIEAFHPEDSVTAWDLKLKLKVALSPLYMTLGVLQERGRVRIVPDGLTYRVHPTANSRPGRSVVGIPLQITVPGNEPVQSKSSA